MKNTRRILALFTAVGLSVSCSAFPAYAEDGAKSDDIVILYTNDVHCGIDDNIGYDGLALYKREMEATHDSVILVDAGDAIQGSPIGSLSKGAYITELMNAVGYDVAIPGNHEFDYGVAELMVRAEELNCGYISANFFNKETGEFPFEAYRIIEAGDKKVAFVGASTPETLSASTPVYFQNDNGEYIYSFGEDGSVYNLIQNAVDNARDEGADYVIVLGHLGESDVTKGWSAPEIAGELTGIDVIIDGHSHETTAGLTVKSKDGKDVIVTQTGTKLNNIGKLTIFADGAINTELIDEVPAPDESMNIAEDTWTEPDGRDGIFVDEAINLKILEIRERLSEELNKNVGHTDFVLTDSDPETGKRIVRQMETNLGDLCADAFREVLGADIGIMNGGGIRDGIDAGDITYNEIISVLPSSNSTLVAEITGQQLLELLEKGAAALPGESGSFIHISGATYSVDDTIESSVTLNDYGEFVSVDGKFRVNNVLIDGKPLDPAKTYTVGSIDYLFKNGVKKYFIGGKVTIVKDDIMSDTEAVITYIKDVLGGVIPDEYSDPFGQGRITMGIAHVLPEGGVPVTWEPSPERLVILTDEARELYERLKSGDYPSVEELLSSNVIAQLDAISDYYIAYYGKTSDISTPEREQLREDIKKEFLAIGSARTESIDENGRHTYVYDGDIERGYQMELVCGLPAAGKSSRVTDPDSEAMKAFILDSDVVKTLIPEYKETFGAAADAIHKESSNITASAIEEFLSGSMKGVNVIIPTVGDGFDKMMEKYIKPFEAAGYNVHVKFVDVDINVSMARNIMRELETGRIINSSIVFSYGTQPLETYLQIKDMTNSFGEKYGLTELGDVSGDNAENPATGVPAPAFMFIFVSLAGMTAASRRRARK